MPKTTIIPQHTVRYHDRNGAYRENRFQVQEELDAFIQRLNRSGGKVYEIVSG